MCIKVRKYVIYSQFPYSATSFPKEASFVQLPESTDKTAGNYDDASDDNVRSFTGNKVHFKQYIDNGTWSVADIADGIEVDVSGNDIKMAKSKDKDETAQQKAEKKQQKEQAKANKKAEKQTNKKK